MGDEQQQEKYAKDADELEQYAKLLTGAVAVVSALGAVFEGTVFSDMAHSGRGALAAAVLLLGLSLALALLSLALSFLARGDAPLNRVKCLLRAQKGLLACSATAFAFSLLATGAAPGVSFLWPDSEAPPRSRHDITYVLDGNGTLTAQFETAGITPFSRVQLYATANQKLLLPRVSDVADQNGVAGIEVKVDSVPCGNGQLSIFAEWDSLGQAQTDRLDVVCPTSP